MTGHSRQQLDGLRTIGRGHELLDNPRGFALRYMRHNKLLGSPDHDDVLSDAMWGIARGIETWDDRDSGMGFTSWCWWKVHSEVRHGRRHRARFAPETLVDWRDLDDPADANREGRRLPAGIEWLRPDVIERGYGQVEDRATLQRWADMAHLTDNQADILAVMAVHGGTIVRHTHLRGDPLMARLRSGVGGEYATLKGALAKIRRVAATGEPWVRTSRPPKVDLNVVRQCVADDEAVAA